MSSPFRMTPLRNRSQTQSHIPYKPLSGFETSTNLSTGWRGGEIQRKCFLLVDYGKDFLMDNRLRTECGEDATGGSLLVILQPTVHQQLIHLISQLQLPSPLGLSLHLTVPGTTHKPRLTDAIWPTFFSTFLIPSQSHPHESIGSLPIVGNVSLRVDKRAARWYEVWKKDPQDGMIGKWVNINGHTRNPAGVDAVRHSKGESSQFTDSPYDLSVYSINIPANEDHDPESSSKRDVIILSTSPRHESPSSHHLNSPQPEGLKTITLPPLSAFSSPASQHPAPEISSRSSTPLSFHSIPYSPIHSMPDPEALATQPFLKELYQRINITQRARSNSDLAKRRGKEGLTIDTKKDIRPPWADLGSAMWSVGTSWGPPTTPEGWDLSPSQRQRQRLQAKVEVEEKSSSISPSKIDFTASPRKAPPIPDGPLDSQNTAGSGSQDDHGTWTFLPKGPVTPTPWKFGWPFHQVGALPSDINIEIYKPPVESPHNRGIKFHQEIEFFESQSQVIHDQLEHLQVSPLPLDPNSLHTPAFELDSPFEIEIEEGIEFEETSPSRSSKLGESPIEEINLSASSPDANPTSYEELLAPLARCPGPSDQIYSQVDISFLQPYTERHVVHPISPFDLDIPVSPFDEDEDEDEGRMDFSMPGLRRPSVLGFEGTQLGIIEEMSNSDASSPASLKMDSPRYLEEASEDHISIPVISVKDDSTHAHLDDGRSIAICEESASNRPLELEEMPIDIERTSTSRVIPRLPTPYARLSEYLLENDQQLGFSSVGSYHEPLDLSCSPVPFQNCIEEDIPSPTLFTTDHLFQYPDKAQHPADDGDDNPRSRTSFMSGIKPIFRSKSQKDRSRSRSSSVGERALSFTSHHEQTNQSVTSLISSNTAATGREPKRPLKKLSQRLSGFGSCPDGGGEENPPSAVAVQDQEGNMMTSRLYDDAQVECHCHYPNLVIYPPLEQPQWPFRISVPIPVYQQTYPDLVIYVPIIQKSAKKGMSSDGSTDNGLSRIPIGLNDSRISRLGTISLPEHPHIPASHVQQSLTFIESDSGGKNDPYPPLPEYLPRIQDMSNSQITKIKTELMNERTYRATRYPPDSNDPKELLLGARRRYSILKASLVSDRTPVDQRISSIKKFTHQRGSSSLSSISSSSIVTPVSESPPFSLDDLNVQLPKRTTPSSTPLTMETFSKAIVPDYFANIKSSASHQSEEAAIKLSTQDTSSQVESDSRMKKRSSTLISERMKAFSSPQAANCTPFSPPPAARKSRNNTYDNLDQSPPTDSPFSPGLGKELGGKKVGRLSRDPIKNWI
ncbi:hypothetical protein L486_02466 [Kwoniella mangroviensis CBS 10435]|uniref:Uncharacterized protein n=1 Tax=Kwoniella mangroviensis CBS 10435 TaxID=1331196 RepID=A0A1B9IW95_9TREE|nr:hypothetical protein L486_02466 [Kwoniella mangroviensis CBS 10435]